MKKEFDRRHFLAALGAAPLLGLAGPKAAGGVARTGEPSPMKFFPLSRPGGQTLGASGMWLPCHFPLYGRWRATMEEAERSLAERINLDCEAVLVAAAKARRSVGHSPKTLGHPVTAKGRPFVVWEPEKNLYLYRDRVAVEFDRVGLVRVVERVAVAVMNNQAVEPA